MNWLEEARTGVSEACGRQHPKRSREHRRLIAQDVAEEIVRDKDIKP